MIVSALLISMKVDSADQVGQGRQDFSQAR
jgi:hypothetical protein